MSDDFLKIVQSVQNTGQAPISMENMDVDTPTSKIITEGVNTSSVIYRFVCDAQSDNNSQNNDDK